MVSTQPCWVGGPMQIPRFKVAMQTKLGLPTLAGCCVEPGPKTAPRAHKRQAVAIAMNTKNLRTWTSLTGALRPREEH